MSERFLAKVRKDEKQGLIIRLPKEIVDKLQLEEGSYLDIKAEEPEEFIVEVDKPVIEELHNMKNNWAMYKDKDESEILKDIMLKYNQKDESQDKNVKNKPLKVVERDSI